MPENSTQLDTADFQDLIEQVTDLVVSLQPNGALRFVNSAWCKTLGYSREEADCLTLFDVLHPNSKHHFEKVLQKTLEGEPFEAIEATLVAKDGREVLVETSGSCRFQDGRPAAIRTIFRDITERKRTEAILQDNERRGELLVEAALDAIISMDQEGLITTWNPQAEATFGWTCTEAVGRPLADLIVPEHLRESHRQGLKRYLTTGDGPMLNRRIQVVALHREGHEFPVELTIAPLKCGKQVTFSGFLRDISERKRAEEALKASEQRYRSLVEMAQDAILLLEDDSICYCNSAGVRLLGAGSLEELLGTPIDPFFHPNEREFAASRRREIRATGEAVPPRTFRVVRLDSEQIYVESYASPCLNQGRPAIQIVFRDITSRKLNESRIREQNHLLELIAVGAPLSESLASLVHHIEGQVPSMLGSVLLLDEDGMHLRHGAAPSLPREYVEAIDGISIGPNVGSCGTAVHRKEAVLVEDIATDPLWADYKNLAVQHGLRSCWSMPILDAQNRVLGTFALYYHEPILPHSDHLRVINDATHIAAIAIGRHRAESQLRNSQQMLRMVLDNIPQGVFWKDRESRYLGCNRVVARAFGFDTPEEIIGKDDYDLPGLTREQAEQFLSKDQQVMNSNRAELGIMESATFADGTSIWMETNKIPIHDASGQVVSILGTWQDITQRRQAEETLKRERARYHHLFEHTPIAIWEEDFSALTEWMDQLRQRGITDLRAYCSAHPDEVQHALSLIRVVDVNQAALIQNAAQSKEQLICGLHTLFLDATLSSFLYQLEGFWQGITSIDYESASQRLDGRPIDLIVHIEVAQQEGKPDWSRVIVTATDITERKQAEEERRKLEAKIQHAQKLESLGVLAGGIAHDFNNLLTSVLGYTSLALVQLPDESPVLAMLREIETAGLRAADLTQQLLAYSGGGKFVLATFRLDALVQEMTQLLDTVVSKKATIRLDLEPTTIEGDATQVRQVVMNLITNASDALDGQTGTITVRTGILQADSGTLRSTFLTEELPAGAYAFVEVADTGGGMSDETLARIFDPFYTTKFTGRGLGLSAVLGIVKSHRGTVLVDSTLGKGTTFTVAFPTTNLPATIEDKRGADELDWRGSGTVLIVDDDEVVRGLAKHMFERMGFNVLLAADGREGVEVYRQESERICLVLLDMTMPRLDGLEAFQEMRQIRGDVRAILASGYNEHTTTKRFTDDGFAAFIQKPYRFDEMMALVRRVLETT